VEATKFVQHLELQHPNKWKEYRGVLQNDSANEVEKFFDNGDVGFVNTMHAYVDTGMLMRFFFDKYIVRVIIGGMLFEPNTSDEKLEAALAVFQSAQDEPHMAERGAYCATVQKRLAVQLTTAYVAAALSFRQARSVLLSTKDKAGLHSLSDVQENDVAKFARLAETSRHN
jgi:hypothetical protein